MTTHPPGGRTETGVHEHTGPPDSGQIRLLLVEDEQDLSAMLVEMLTEEGYQVEHAADGQRGLHLGLTRGYEVIVLDRQLPGIEGVDLMGRWRRHGITTPVLVLSALGNPADRIAGLDGGAEDYLSKPFDVDELLARLRALRRRHLDTARVMPAGHYQLNLDTREVIPAPDHPNYAATDIEAIRLSTHECDLLAALAARPTQVLSRDQLLANVFPDAENPIIVDTYVHYLRRKLGRGVIDTIRGRGYRLGPP